MSSTVTAERTPLYEEHLRLGARMTTFGGWLMPLQYRSIREEHLAVRQAAGMFDLSHMGEISITGPDAQALVQHLVSRNISRLKPGRAQYAVLCNEQGGILDDLLVYATSEGYLLVVNASNQDPDAAWIEQKARGFSAQVKNVGRETALIGVQGPRAVEIVQSEADQDLSSIRYYGFIDGRIAGRRGRFSRTGYTGEDGFEIFARNEDAPHIWSALLARGTPLGLLPAGLGARDTLRLEAGMRLYGVDMDDSTNPLEAALEWTVSFDKDFVGKEAIEEARERGLSRLLVGITMEDRSIPRHGYSVRHDHQPVGRIASGNVSFTLGKNIGTAYVPPSLAPVGTRLAVEVREMEAPAVVAELPFYQRPRPK